MKRVQCTLNWGIVISKREICRTPAYHCRDNRSTKHRRKSIRNAVWAITFILWATEVRNKGHRLHYGAIHGHSSDINDPERELATCANLLFSRSRVNLRRTSNESDSVLPLMHSKGKARLRVPWLLFPFFSFLCIAMVLNCVGRIKRQALMKRLIDFHH